MTVTTAQRTARRPRAPRPCGPAPSVSSQGCSRPSAPSMPRPSSPIMPMRADRAGDGWQRSIPPSRRPPPSRSPASISSAATAAPGKLILRFSGDGAMPDLRTQGSNVVVDVGNASLPASLQRPLNVTDFATPVQRIDAKQSGIRHAAGAEHQWQRSSRWPTRPAASTSSRSCRAQQRPAAPSARTVPRRRRLPARRRSDWPARAYRGRPVTFNFQDVPVRTVLQLIAEESNLNIVASDTVQGNVTLRLINVPWDQALDIVLQAKSLDKRRSGNVVWVAPQAEIAKFEQDKEDARIAIEEPRRDGHRVHPDQLRQRRRHRQAADRREQEQPAVAAAAARAARRAAAASCRRAAASASTAAPIRC